jgi:hypothetical protein
MKKIFAIIGIVVITFAASPGMVRAQSGDTTVEYKSSGSQFSQGQEFTIDVIIKNPGQAGVISARTWLEYNANHLEGISIDTSNTPYTLAAPGEDGFDAGAGHVKIGRSNIGGGAKDTIVTLAKIKFKVKTDSKVSTALKPHDYQLTELGHNSINIIEDGFPVNILSTRPNDVIISLNANAGGVGGGTVTPPVIIEPPLTPQGLLRPDNVWVNTGLGYAELKWDFVADPNRVGYHVYYGKSSGHYSRRRTLGNVNSARIDGLNNGEAYFFALTAYDRAANESDYSNEVAVIIGQPLSSTAPFEGLLNSLLGQLPYQPDNGPMVWWLGLSAAGLAGSTLFRSKKIKN